MKTYAEYNERMDASQESVISYDIRVRTVNFKMNDAQREAVFDAVRMAAQELAVKLQLMNLQGCAVVHAEAGMNPITLTEEDTDG